MVPLIDMREQNGNKTAFANQLGQSLHEFGFVRLINHGVPEKAILDADEAGRRFWALPAEVKDVYSREPYKVGTRVGYARNAETALSADKVDIKEEWGINAHPEPPYDAKAMLAAVTQVPDLGGKVLKLFDSFEKLSVRLMRSIALYSGEDERALDPWFENSASYMRLLHYPGGGNAAGHLDFNMLTLLHVSEPGLWVRDRKGGEHEITTGKGELVLNGGMQLGLITNDHLRPSWHWVEAAQPRTSIPFFLHPRRDVVLHPLIRYVGQPPAKAPPYFPEADEKGWVTISTGEFNDLRLKEIYERQRSSQLALGQQLAL